MDPVEKLKTLERRQDVLEVQVKTKDELLQQNESHLRGLSEVIDKLQDENRSLKEAVNVGAEVIEKLRKDAEFGARFRELLASIMPPSQPTGSTGQNGVVLGKTEWVVNVEKKQVEVKADDSTCRGRILALGSEGLFDKPQLLGEVMARINQVYGSRDTTQQVLQTLVELCQDGLMAREQQSNKQWKYNRPTSVTYKS